RRAGGAFDRASDWCRTAHPDGVAVTHGGCRHRAASRSDRDAMLGETTRFDATARGPFMRELLARVRALPGVRDAGLGSNLPPSLMQIQIGVRFNRADEMQMLSLAGITPGYIPALGGRLIRGRFFEPGDELTGGGVAVLSETAARVLSRD